MTGLIPNCIDQVFYRASFDPTPGDVNISANLDQAKLDRGHFLISAKIKASYAAQKLFAPAFAIHEKTSFEFDEAGSKTSKELRLGIHFLPDLILDSHDLVQILPLVSFKEAQIVILNSGTKAISATLIYGLFIRIFPKYFSEHELDAAQGLVSLKKPTAALSKQPAVEVLSYKTKEHLDYFLHSTSTPYCASNPTWHHYETKVLTIVPIDLPSVHMLEHISSPAH